MYGFWSASGARIVVLQDSHSDQKAHRWAISGEACVICANEAFS